MQLLMRIRLARNFLDYEQRLKCVMARLQAISILGTEEREVRVHIVYLYVLLLVVVYQYGI